MHPSIVTASITKFQLMSRRLINRVIILSFLALVTFSISWSIQTGSTTGLILSMVSLATGLHFIYLLRQLNRQQAGSDPDM